MAKFVGELGICHTEAGLKLITFLQQSCHRVYQVIGDHLASLRRQIQDLDRAMEMIQAKQGKVVAPFTLSRPPPK